MYFLSKLLHEYVEKSESYVIYMTKLTIICSRTVFSQVAADWVVEIGTVGQLRAPAASHIHIAVTVKTFK